MREGWSNHLLVLTFGHDRKSGSILNRESTTWAKDSHRVPPIPEFQESMCEVLNRFR